MKNSKSFAGMRLLPLLMVLAAMVGGCREVDNVVYSSFSSIDADGWDPVESFEFSPFPADSATAFNYSYDVRVMVRYDRSATNRKLPLIVEQSVDDAAFRRDSVVFTLFDSEGNPSGDGSLGIYEKELLVAPGTRLSPGYKVNVYSLLNKADSKGILNVGVSLTRTTP